MADWTASNLITAVNPDRNAINIATNQIISVQFLRDMDRSTFSDSTISLQILGTVLRVPVTISYNNRVLTITPTTPLQPGTSYKVELVGDVTPIEDILTNNISGIKDITGNGFVDIYNWVFRTTDMAVPLAPSLVSPSNEIAILVQPTFVWTAIPGISYYEIEVSIFNTFETIFWPISGDSYNQTLTSVTPSRPFNVAQEYWWRVRSVVTDPTTHLPTVGDWSVISNFYYGDPTYGTVSTEDASLGVFSQNQQLTQILYAVPTPGSSNVSEFPDQITVVISGEVNIDNLNPKSLFISSQPVDGTWAPGEFRPVFAATLNGSQFGGGGIVINGPADTYQAIIPSIDLQNITPEGNFDGTNTTITLNVPQDYWQNNNLYSVTLDLQELQSPVIWSFTSQWSPIFESPHGVRQTTDFFIPELTDDDLYYTIRRNSLYTIWIQVYMPTKVNANSQIYQPPISFNVNNPPWHVREYVRIKSSLDFLKMKYMNLLVQGTTTLADFTVAPQTSALKENINLAIQELKTELKQFEDAIRGVYNRGYARGEHAQRGSGPGGQIDTFNFPYRTSNWRNRNRF